MVQAQHQSGSRGDHAVLEAYHYGDFDTVSVVLQQLQWKACYKDVFKQLAEA